MTAEQQTRHAISNHRPRIEHTVKNVQRNDRRALRFPEEQAAPEFSHAARSYYAQCESAEERAGHIARGWPQARCPQKFLPLDCSHGQGGEGNGQCRQQPAGVHAFQRKKSAWAGTRERMMATTAAEIVTRIKGDTRIGWYLPHSTWLGQAPYQSPGFLIRGWLTTKGSLGRLSSIFDLTG